MSAADIQSLIRFLAQDAKVPLATSMAKIKELQQANLDSIDKLAKTTTDDIKSIFDDDKLAKQVLNAAKRVSKKRAAGQDAGPSPTKKRKDESLFSIKTEPSPDELESSLQLPYTDASAEELEDVILFSNRAPIMLALTVTLLKYTMPEQPLSSRLSLAQAYVSTTSRSRAVSLGLESGRSAEEEGFGEGQPSTSIMGKELRVLRRWGYEWRNTDAPAKTSSQTTLKVESETLTAETEEAAEKPPLWALDLESLRKSKAGVQHSSTAQSANTANLPIHTPQSARAYLLKSFETPPKDSNDSSGKKKRSAAEVAAEKERNLGMLLRAIDLVYQSWVDTIGPDGIETRVWGWYVKARPAVETGVAGWGGRNRFKLADILSSRRDHRQSIDTFFKKES